MLVLAIIVHMLKYAQMGAPWGGTALEPVSPGRLALEGGPDGGEGPAGGIRWPPAAPLPVWSWGGAPAAPAPLPASLGPGGVGPQPARTRAHGPARPRPAGCRLGWGGGARSER